MTKNSRRIASFWLAYSMFFGAYFPLEVAKKSGFELPTKGMKGLTNQQLNANFKAKNKRKKPNKRLKK